MYYSIFIIIIIIVYLVLLLALIRSLQSYGELSSFSCQSRLSNFTVLCSKFRVVKLALSRLPILQQDRFSVIM